MLQDNPYSGSYLVPDKDDFEEGTKHVKLQIMYSSKWWQSTLLMIEEDCCTFEFVDQDKCRFINKVWGPNLLSQPKGFWTILKNSILNKTKELSVIHTSYKCMLEILTSLNFECLRRRKHGYQEEYSYCLLSSLADKDALILLSQKIS